MNLSTINPAICAGITSLLTSVAVSAATPLPTTAPEKVGFSKEGLARIDQFFAREIAADRVPGAVIAIARDGKLVHYKAYGSLNKATGEPMPLNAIFNLASMTKVMTAVGGLTLNEEGKLPLKSPLGQYLPAFAKMNVGVVGTGEIKLEPANPIYIHDLYRTTANRLARWCMARCRICRKRGNKKNTEIKHWRGVHD